MCSDPTYVASALRERRSRPLAELGAAAHRILQLRAVRLDAERRAARRSDRAAHQHMVGEHEVGGQQLPQRGRVRIDVCASFGLGEVLEELRIEPLVAVHDEGGQQAAGQVDRDRPRAAEVVLLGRPLLRDDDDVVPGAAPLARQRAGVDVRPGPSEQVPVPEQDPHRGRRYSEGWVPGTVAPLNLIRRSRTRFTSFELPIWPSPRNSANQIHESESGSVAVSERRPTRGGSTSACNNSTAGFEVCTVTSLGTSSRPSE